MNKFSFDTVRTSNSQAKNLATNPVGVFVGGTSGIGQHTAYSFAANTVSPTLYIVGRDTTAGQKTIAEIEKLNQDAKAYFLAHDLTLIKEADKLVSEITSKESKVNLLCLSTGYLTVAGRQETSEGNDRKMTINYYSRWRIVEKLMPLLETAADLDEPSRVVNVLAAGSEGPLIEDDLGLKHHYSLRNVNKHFVTFTSLATERFAKLYPKISFSHTYPGLVNTGIGRELPIWLRGPLSPVMTYFGESASDAGDKFFYLGYSGPEFKSGSFLLDNKLRSVKEKSLKYLSPEMQEKAWKHTEEVFAKSTPASEQL